MEGEREGGGGRAKAGVMPYLHGLSHNLKNLGRRSPPCILPPYRLERLCVRTSAEKKKKEGRYQVNCSTRFAVVYEIPDRCSVTREFWEGGGARDQFSRPSL